MHRSKSPQSCTGSVHFIVDISYHIKMLNSVVKADVKLVITIRLLNAFNLDKQRSCTVSLLIPYNPSTHFINYISSRNCLARMNILQ